MKNSKTVIIGLVVVVGLAIMIFGEGINGDGVQTSTINDLLGGEKVVMYKSPTCGCCGVYSSYLKGKGVAVDIQDVADLNVIKEEFNITPSLQSCHTMKVGGYIVEGHIPLEAIEKLLTEKPDIRGIAMPGMPSGSPGMPGPKAAPFIVYVLGGAEGEIYTTI